MLGNSNKFAALFTISLCVCLLSCESDDSSADPSDRTFTESLTFEDLVGAWKETEMLLVSNNCGDYPLESIESVHPFYIMKKHDDGNLEVVDCGETLECERRDRSLGMATLEENTLTVVLVKSSSRVYIEDDSPEYDQYKDVEWDCFEQDTIEVTISFSSMDTGKETRVLSNKMTGDGCEEFIAAWPEAANFDGCEAVFTYDVTRI